MSKETNSTGDGHEMKNTEPGTRQERAELSKARVELFKTLATFGAFAILVLSIGGPLILLLAPNLDDCHRLLSALASGAGGFIVVGYVLWAYCWLAKDTRLCSPPPKNTGTPSDRSKGDSDTRPKQKSDEPTSPPSS